MAQFRGTIKGSRDKTTSRLGHRTTGLITECNGWNIGITCRAVYDEKQGLDVIEVYKTSGSSPHNHKTLIAIVKEGE